MSKSSGPENDRTEGSLVKKKFADTDQAEWSRLSKEAESTLSEMFSQGKTLMEMCEYAKVRRRDIAFKLNHAKSFLFGENREDDFSDKYNHEQYAGSAPNQEAVFLMKKIISQHKTIGDYPLAEDSQLNRSPSVVSHILKGGSIEKEILILLHEDKVSKNISIECVWPSMSREKYKEVLDEMDSIRAQLSDKSCQGERALFLIGLLAYDLSNIVLYKRGSAAITGWIIRAIAKEKGFDLDKALRVNGLAFDIYAQVQSREQYALDFVDSMKKEFALEFSPEEKQTFAKAYQTDNEKVYVANLEKACVKFITSYVINSSDTNEVKLAKLQAFCKTQNFKNFDALSSKVIELSSQELDNGVRLLIDFLLTIDTLNQKDTQCFKNKILISTINDEMISKKDEYRRTPYFKIDHDIIEGQEIITISGGGYIKPDDYPATHSINKNMPQFERFLYDKLGLSNVDIKKYLKTGWGPDDETFSIPAKEVPVLAGAPISSEKSPYIKRQPAIASMFDKQPKRDEDQPSSEKESEPVKPKF